MRNIFIIPLFLLSSCGFSSYYSDSNNSQTEVKDIRVREEINLTKVEFRPTENADRILKDELLMRMERLDENDTKDYRYIMLISTNYQIFPSIISPAGAYLGMQIIFNAKYIIVDTGKINNNTREETEEVSIDRLPAEAIHGPTAPILKDYNIHPIIPASASILTGNPKTTNEAKEEHFERQAVTLRSNFKIVQEGQVSNTEQYLTSTILLYDDYTNMERSLELVGKITARDLMYNLIGIYADYLKHNYNTAISEPLDSRNNLDILVDRVRNKTAPLIVEHFSIPAFRDKIVGLFNKKPIDAEIKKPDLILQ